ncbi:MAG: thiol-disulfide oxidoreductase DCC family protein [Sphingobacteriales bacterium]|nr:MAG: thiol-disulfide oxidoreductase DCC family protein [Sphingobacteriales bacterium]
MAEDATYPVLYFDGVCNLCNNTVRFIIKHDKKKQFRFAALQSVSGQMMADKLKDTESVILAYKGEYYSKSDAALKTMAILGGIWRVGLVGHILPSFLRNMLYDWVARNRYRWFGRLNQCMIPTPELKSRFLD